MKNQAFLTSMLFAGWAVAASGPVLAQQKLVPNQSEVTFVARQMGVPLDGQFKKFDAQINFNPAKLDASQVAFTIDIGSATLGSRETDAELPKAEWFNTKMFPQASFQSSGFKALGGGRYDVTGKLTIKGTARDVTVPVTIAQNGASTTATGLLALKRLAFKIGENEWADTSMVADDVQVKFKLALTGVGKL